MSIRLATSRERDDVMKQWASSFAPGKNSVTIGSTARTILSKHWKRAHKMLVAYLLAESECHVLVLDDVPSEPLGWVVFVPGGELHYVYVLDKARRCGLGRRLLEHARDLGAGAPSHMTASGRSLEGESDVRQEEAQAPSQVLMHASRNTAEQGNSFDG